MSTWVVASTPDGTTIDKLAEMADKSNKVTAYSVASMSTTSVEVTPPPPLLLNLSTFVLRC